MLGVEDVELPLLQAARTNKVMKAKKATNFWIKFIICIFNKLRV
jgi:hypothetical protein